LPSDATHAVIRRAYGAFAARDLATLRSLSHPEVSVRAMTGALARDDEPYLGHDGLERYLIDVATVWDELELLPAEFHDLDPERVLVVGRVRARRGSTLLDSPNAWVWHVRDGLVISAELYGDPDAAMLLLGDALE
jgi:ketosteroid isomerase-like protein